jgi:hypothetical protein
MLSPARSAFAPASPAPQPAPGPTPAPAAGGGDAPEASFARSLQQARQPRPDAAGRGVREPARPQQGADKAGKAEKADKAHADGAQGPEDGDTPAAQAPHDDPAAALNQLLPGWNPALPRAEAGPRRDGAAQDTADDAGAAQRPAVGAARRRDATAVAAADAHDLRTPAQAATRFDAAMAAADTSRADSPGAAADPAVRSTPAGEAPLPALQAAAPAAAHGAAATAGAPAPGAAAPFEARLSAALGSPDFAPALGVQVSILMREGVQQARLHLNPAEMGPIAVQIALDGQNAQVHFQADHAATRDALQASLPELAAALQDNGFTLSGGGVSDPRRDAPQQQGEGGPGQRPAGGVTDARADGASTAPAAAPARMPRRQGVVDLYA